MSFLQRYPIVQRLLPQPSARRRGYPMPDGVRFVVAHDTGNPDATAAQNVDWLVRTANPRGTEVSSAHLFVDDLRIIECIPVFDGRPEKAWHVLSSPNDGSRMFGQHPNDAAVGIEYCYGVRIDAEQAYRRYVWLIAYCCWRFGLDPGTHVVGHFMLDPHRRTDPVTGLLHSRRSYEQLLRDVVREYDVCQGRAPAIPAVRPALGRVVATTRLHIRRNLPGMLGDVCGVAEPGMALAYVGVVDDGDAINGNRRWYCDANGDYFWSGGTVAV